MISNRCFGVTSKGKEVTEFRVSNEQGMYINVLDYGCIIQSVYVHDCNNRLRDVVLGFDSIDGYEKDHSYLGAVLGRCANRIDRQLIDINGKKYTLSDTGKGMHIHGGNKSFGRVMWHAKQKDNTLILSRRSPDEEEGYPGNVDVNISITVSENNELIMEYSAVPDRDTIINLSNHSYFNLDGTNKYDSKGGFNIGKHLLKIEADRITHVINNKDKITGEYLVVDKTALDYKSMHLINDMLESDNELIKQAYGCDFNYVLDNEDKVKLAATVKSQESGIVMECYTDMPGIQVYTGNYLNKKGAKYGLDYRMHSAICLETQGYPNAAIIKEFPSVVVNKGEVYKKKTIYKFRL